MDFIGALGGVTDILLQICGWIIGGYAAFHSAFMTMSQLYTVKNVESDVFKPSKKPTDPNLSKIKLNLCERIMLYFH